MRANKQAREREREENISIYLRFILIFFVTIRESSAHMLRYVYEEACQLTSAHTLGSRVLCGCPLYPFLLGEYTTSHYTFLTITYVEHAGGRGSIGFSTVPSPSTRHRFSIVECGPGGCYELNEAIFRLIRILP